MRTVGNSAARPRIACSTWRRQANVEPYGAFDLQAVGSDYVACVQSAGAQAVLVPHDDPSSAADLLDGSDALLLIGGEDVAPETYGDVNWGASLRTSPLADSFEVALVRAARDLGLPVLAVCRGMQILNVAFGGTLTQDLVPGTIDHKPAAADIPAPTPPISVAAGGVLHEIYGAQVTVNSLHHQAVDRCGDGLRVVARAPDGIVEAIESVDAQWPAIGVQWHPEKTVNGADLFEWLATQALHTRARRRGPGLHHVLNGTGAGEPSSEPHTPKGRP